MNTKVEKDLFAIEKSTPPKTFEKFWELNLEYYQGMAKVDLDKHKAKTDTLTQLLGLTDKDASLTVEGFIKKHKKHYDNIAKDDYGRLLQLNNSNGPQV